MTTRVVHYRLEPFDVSIMRPTMWGNPFIVGIHGKQGECVEKFRRWVKTSSDDKAVLIRLHVERLRGKTLGCACKHRSDIPCHGDVYVEMLDDDGGAVVGSRFGPRPTSGFGRIRAPDVTTALIRGA